MPGDTVLPQGSFSVDAYLKRLGLTGPLKADAETLQQLQYAHVHRIPYENLDILMDIPLSLDVGDIFKKVVVQERGGYCFELNALLRHLLVEMGYSVTSYFARFWQDEPNPPPKPRHHVLDVHVEGRRYLADVGVGGIVPRWPVVMEDGLVQEQGEETYRLVKLDFYGWMLERLVKGQWRRIFSFTEEPKLQRDFLTTSFWCEYAQDSIFRMQPMVMIRRENGRNTYDGKEFRLFRGEDVHVEVPQSYEQLLEGLYAYFGIHLYNHPRAERLWERVRTAL